MITFNKSEQEHQHTPFHTHFYREKKFKTNSIYGNMVPYTAQIFLIVVEGKI